MAWTALISGRCVTRTHLAELYGCHPRMICCHLLEFGLSEPGPLVFTTEVHEDGTSAIQPFHTTELQICQGYTAHPILYSTSQAF
jgi:hypothetical protein